MPTAPAQGRSLRAGTDQGHLPCRDRTGKETSLGTFIIPPNLCNKTVLLSFNISKEKKKKLPHFNCGIHFTARTDLLAFVFVPLEQRYVHVPSNQLPPLPVFTLQAAGPGGSVRSPCKLGPNDSYQILEKKR